jgi:fumarylpyruvate hydrolase
MTFSFSASPPAVLSIHGNGNVIPVRRIYTIGRNYADHAAETGLGAISGSVPGISLKPSDSVLSDGQTLPYPSKTEQLDAEIEMVVVIGRQGRNIPTKDALDYVFGYAVGLDMIRRDIMQDCIANEHSWDLCKSFRGASPVGQVRLASEIGHPNTGEIRLQVNGVARQKGDIAKLIWKTSDIVARLSAYDAVYPGDIVFTGTPKGPGPVSIGDKLECYLEGVGNLNISIG